MNTSQNIARAHSAATLAGFVGLHLLVGAIGGITTASSVDGWYQTLTKPGFNPPDFVFAPAWTALYVLTAIAVWRVWRSHHHRRATALRLYGLQLFCNFAWSPLFFGLKNPALALADMALMVPAAFACQVLFLRIDRSAGWMWIPYIAWISFAAVLNLAIVLLN